MSNDEITGEGRIITLMEAAKLEGDGGAELPEGRREAMSEFLDAFAGDGGGAFREAAWSGYVGGRARYDAGSCTYEAVADDLDGSWSDFLMREGRAVEEMASRSSTAG